MNNSETVDSEILSERMEAFKQYLVNEEKSDSTIEGYMRNIKRFIRYAGDGKVSKNTVLEYKSRLIKMYKTATINAALSAINSFFDFLGYLYLKVKTIKMQKEIFYSEDKELTKADYEKLLHAAMQKKHKRIYYIMQTIAATGIRVSELKYITTEALNKKYAEVRCKGKNRIVILPDDLCVLLKGYVRENNIKRGSVFVTRTGRTLDRTAVWREMCDLCKTAGVKKSKVFPHNLRHLFARTYYSHEKDIVRLADILGHSSVNTTRIYTMESGQVHRRQIQMLGLVLKRDKKITTQLTL